MPVSLALLLSLVIGLASPPEAPLLPAHSHNDYEHPRPLFDALSHRFASVEADVHFTNGVLLVAHDAKDVRAERTLEKLYLEPLRDRAQRQEGRIYKGSSSPLILLIDIKTAAEPAWTALEATLRRFEPILTRFSGEEISSNAVTVILSGNRPREQLLQQTNRLAAFDGRLADLGKELPVAFMPLVSDNWRNHFKWDGRSALPEEERRKLKELVRRAHSERRALRLWATPDTVEAWRELRDAGVDLINTDNLAGLAEFLEPANRPGK